MPFPLFLAALAFGQEPAQDPATIEASFQTPFVIAEPNRLAMTPKLDGEMSDEEWDPLASTGDFRSYFQWEPGKLHAAATVPVGHDLLISLDFQSNGWLIGADNVEVRVTNVGGAPKVVGRLVDATNVAGPTWVELPALGMAAQVAANATDLGTTYEVTVSDPGLGMFPTKDGKSIGVRLDTVASDAAPPEPYIPRMLAPVSLVYRRAAAVPTDLRWNIEGAGNSVTPTNTIRLRYTFNGNNQLGLKKLNLRSEGFVKDDTTQASIPFPLFDNKGRAFVDYETQIRPDATPGYRVARGSLEAGDGLTALIQGSYRVAPVIDIEVVRETIKSLPRDQRVKITYFIRSNSPRRVEGTVALTLPTGFHLISSQDKKFAIHNGKGSARRVIEMDIPANTKGIHPLVIKTEMGGQTIEKTAYLDIR